MSTQPSSRLQATQVEIPRQLVVELDLQECLHLHSPVLQEDKFPTYRLLSCAVAPGETSFFCLMQNTGNGEKGTVSSILENWTSGGVWWYSCGQRSCCFDIVVIR